MISHTLKHQLMTVLYPEGRNYKPCVQDLTVSLYNRMVQIEQTVEQRAQRIRETCTVQKVHDATRYRNSRIFLSPCEKV